MNEDQPTSYLTTEEVAKLLKSCKKTVYRMVQRGILPQPFRPSKRTLLFDPAEIFEYLRRSRESRA